MNLFARRLEWQFQRNHRRHVFANELMAKFQRMRECFPGSSLPSPTAEVIAAWNDVPNDTVDILPMPMNLVFLRAPLPTPTGVACDTDDATQKDAPPNDSSDDGWLLANDTHSPSSDGVTFQDLGGSTASEADEMSRCSYADQLVEQTSEEDSSQSAESNSPSSSDHESSSGSQDSPKSAGFRNMVNQWLSDYRTRGTDAFIESLIAFGVMSLESASLASRIARAVIRKVTKASYTEGKDLETAIRFSALATFRKHWGLTIQSDTWTETSATHFDTASTTPHGINIASLMGSMFDAKVSNAKDVHLCLSLLLAGEKRFDRLCAMHALLVQANDKLCKTRNLDTLMQFSRQITSRDSESGEYLWATAPHSKALITDILTTMERWTVSQSLRRDPCRSSSGNRTIRKPRAVGPRLRSGPRH